jgi:hypothetical protein
MPDRDPGLPASSTDHATPLRFPGATDPEVSVITLGHLTRAMGLVMGTTPEAHRYFVAALKVATVAAESGERAPQVQSRIEQIMKQLTAYLAIAPSGNGR